MVGGTESLSHLQRQRLRAGGATVHDAQEFRGHISEVRVRICLSRSLRWRLLLLRLLHSSIRRLLSRQALLRLLLLLRKLQALLVVVLRQSRGAGLRAVLLHAQLLAALLRGLGPLADLLRHGARLILQGG